MARIHGKVTYVSVNGTDISTYCTSAEFSESVDTHDSTGYGADAKSYLGGLKDSTFKCEGSYDSTAGTGPRATLRAILNGAPVTVIRGPEGQGTGLPADTFQAICTTYVETSPVADKVTWSADFQTSGDVDDTAQA